MKIGIVCFNLNWLMTGGPRLLFSEARALKALGHAVAIYAPEFDGKDCKELWDGLDVRVVAPKYPFAYEGGSGFVGWIWGKFRQERLHVDTSRRIAGAMDADFDVVNVHDYAYRLAPFYKKRNRRTKIVWTMNEPPYMHLPKPNAVSDALSRLFNRYKEISSRKYFRAIDAVVILNKNYTKWVERRGMKAVVVRPGADFRKFYAPPRKRSAGDASVKLLAVGAPNQYRRFEDTIRAASLLRKRGYDARVTIVGKNVWNEDEYCAMLKNLAAKELPAGAAQFRFDGLPEEKLIEAYRTHDVFVSTIHLPPPRNGYGWQLTVFEAMAAGEAVVIYRTNDSTEILEDGATALFTDPMSPEQIAGKIEFLIKNPDAYGKIAEAGQRLVEKEFSWDNYAKKVLEAAA